MTRSSIPLLRSWTALGLLLWAGGARPDSGSMAASPEPSPEVIHELDRAMARLAAKVSPAVVQVQATGYHPPAAASPCEPLIVARQRSIGSGVIVDPGGYIVTNHHVVHGAQRVQVLLPGSTDAPGDDDSARRLFEATVVGSEPDLDLAVLKIDARGLPALALDSARAVHKGELVFAIGSPEGLASSITMGIVSSAARSVEGPGKAMNFIQTDAPINPGNSGGPLVNASGVLVGINAFIVSLSGGSQGLGFAIPSPMVRLAFDGIRKHGRLQVVEVGAVSQSITPILAAALGLPRNYGVIVSDVALGGAARAAGVEPGDVIVSLDGKPIDNMADLTSAHYLHPLGEPVLLVLLRGDRRLSLKIAAPEMSPPAEQLLDLASPEAGMVRRLGILGVDVTAKLHGVIPPLRVGSGVVVAARTLDATRLDTGLLPGDVIHAVNRTGVDSLAGLRQAIGAVKAGDPVAIQIERQGKFMYLSFEME
ncbi:MAG TPA: trypsin-like peptidase domain-containing protein [Anaeromyxobacteraceae bacterium]|nr:trypsin-like peptidase domain-containing protein [Anaeromyxobacteraceae bacterium]